jgi:hypothetical protein
MAAVSVIPVVLDYFDDEIVRAEILPKTRCLSYQKLQILVYKYLYLQIFVFYLHILHFWLIRIQFGRNHFEPIKNTCKIA